MGNLQPVAPGEPRRVKRNLEDVEPIDYDLLDRSSVDDVKEGISAWVRQENLTVARMSVLRDAISICYKQHGPNHAVKCRPIYIEYLRMLEQRTKVRFPLVELHPEPSQDANATTKEDQ